MSARRWLGLKTLPSPVTAWINSVLACYKLRYLSFVDIMGFRRPRPDFLTDIVFIVPTMGERGFGFLNKMQGKKVSWSIFSTPVNVSPLFFLTHCRNIFSYCISRTTKACLFWVTPPSVLLIVWIFPLPFLCTLFQPIAFGIIIPIKPPR